MKIETINEAVRAAPPVGVAGLSIWGIALNEWVLLLTAFYTIFLLVDKFPTVVSRFQALIRWVKERNGKSN